MLKMQAEMREMDKLEAETRAWAHALAAEFDDYYDEDRHKNNRAVRTMLINQIGEEQWLQAVNPDYEFNDITDAHNDIRLQTESQSSQPPRKRAQRKYKGGRKPRKKKPPQQ